MRINLWTLLFCGVLMLPTFVQADMVSAVAALVNDDVITTYEVERETSLLVKEMAKNAPTDATSRDKLRSVALNRLIDRKLVEQKVKELEIRVSEEEIRQSIEDVKKQNNLSQEALVAALKGQGLTFEEYKVQLREQLERLRLVSQEVKAKIQVSEREMREYYEANGAVFGGEEQFKARHIFFKLDKKATAQEIKRVMAHALTVLYEARAGKDFVELAKKYSEDPNAQKDGGDLGTFRKGDMSAEIEETVVGMKAGDISDLVNSTVGLHIIKLESRAPGKAKPFEQVKVQIEDILYRKKSEERFARWVHELRQGAAIEIRRGDVASPQSLLNRPSGTVS
jgi:peptidyl-prolyl cis-trans isomerase SurA